MRRSQPLSLSLLLLAAPLVSWSYNLDAEIRAEMRLRSIPGVVYGVFKDGKVVKSGAYGSSDLERGVKATTANVFEIGSVSKQFTATVILMLFEEGKLSLDDHIDKYVAGLPPEWSPVTLRNLLNHTSGIPDIEEIFGYDSYRNIYTKDEIVKVANSRPVEFPPGSKWHYSNTGYYLLGLVVEKVTGKPYIEAMTERVFKPLGMTHTRESDPWAVIPNRAVGYQLLNGVIQNRDAMQPTACKGAGTLVSTIEDMAKWDAAVTQNRLVKPESQQLMWTPSKLTTGNIVNYGFGWFMSDWRGNESVEHSGGTAGYSCDYRRFQKLGFSVMVFCNLYATGVEKIEILAADTVHPGLSYLSMKTMPEDKPRTRETLLKALADVAKGGDSSPYFTASMWKQYTDASRTTWKKRLTDMKSFELVDRQHYTEKPSPLGEKVTETDVYRLKTSTATMFIVFMLTPESKVALQNRQDY